MDKEKIRENIENIKKEVGNNATLVAVTKTVDVDTVKFLKELGLNDFGENRIEVAEEKIKKIEANWHMIGHLQSNKVKKAVKLFHVIQSVDSVSLAEEIDKEARKQNKIMKIFVQVNIANESQKFGFEEKDVKDAIQIISKLDNVKIEGFMMIAPHIEAERTRVYFKDMRKLYNRYKKEYELTRLSMGMSNDYKVAISEGSNMVRIGTKLYE